MHQAKILVVEDDVFLMRALGSVFQAYGFESQFCMDGKTGMGLAHSWEPDIILLDVHLPELNGLCVLTDLKQTPDTAAIPVLIMTGYPDEEGRRIAISMGAIGYLAKPLSPEELISIIQERVTGSAALRKLTASGVISQKSEESDNSPTTS
ncbi:MAG: response regulator [Verrucomicrobia bacterium]|nr:response regulator [Verrucomicrobiota bacterium]